MLGLELGIVRSNARLAAEGIEPVGEGLGRRGAGVAATGEEGGRGEQEGDEG